MQDHHRIDLVRRDEQVEVQNTSLVVFDLAQQSYALPVDAVEQIIEMVTITPLPQEIPRIDGVINVRGTMVPVVDLGSVLGLAPLQLGLHTPIVLVRTCGRTIGLIVDRVRDVRSLPVDQVLRPEDFLPVDLNGAPFIEGVVGGSDRTILVLDLEHLFVYEGSGLAQILDYLAMLDDSVQE